MSISRLALGWGPVILLAAPLVIALASLSGIGHRWVDILAQFAAPALVATLALTVTFALLRRWQVTAGALGVAAVLLLAVWPQWWPKTGRPDPGAAVVRLYSANLFYRNDDVAAIRRSIVAADPDIIVLLELGREPARRSNELLAGYPYRVAPEGDVDRIRGPWRSVIASRYPLAVVPHRADALHDVVAVAKTPLGSLNIVGVHLTRPWPFQVQWGQISQTTTLAGIVRDLTGPVIVAGDFNSVSSARIGKQVRRELGLIPATGFPGTWPSALPSLLGMTIDQVYHSPDLVIVSRRLGRPTGSDHRPVVTEITRAAG